MGVINVTPDSFSDGGATFDPAQAIAAGLAMIQDGAAILDIGGESTRPGASIVPPNQEQARIHPVITGLRNAGVPISIDTRNASTMAAALDAGASIINDVSALTHDPASLALVASRGVPVILMHMRGTPQTMADHAVYTDLVAEVAAELAEKIKRATTAGVARSNIAIDPGFGFAKNATQNLVLLRALRSLQALGLPLVAGLSRKRFLAALGGDPDAAKRDAESIAAGLFAVGQGASILRVHNVAGTVRALTVWQALSA